MFISNNVYSAMLENRIRTLIREGEGLRVEFKTCKTELNRNVYETVCAFLNRHGGELLLGVDDHGKMTGIDPGHLDRMKKDFVTTINNPAKIMPSVYLSIEHIEIDGKHMLYVCIPESSQVHRCNGKIFDRNQDGDFDITDNHHLVTGLYMNKQIFFTENRVYPYCELSDLRSDLLAKARMRAGFQRDHHPWSDLSDMELLQSARLFSKDVYTQKEGMTLAGILLFGKDETILSALSHHKTDLILRRVNLDRYDDRDDVRTNLIESYEHIIAFGQKHLPDPFYLEGTQRISVRDKILREIASNILIHREYLNPFPARVIIETDRIYAENSNKPRCHGLIDPANYTPYPKNPCIARVFKEIGLADELGSGVRNLMKYVHIFSNTYPELHDTDVFKIIVPLVPPFCMHDAEQVRGQAAAQVTAQVTAQVAAQVGIFCLEPRSAKEIMRHLGLKHWKTFQKNYLNPLLAADFLERTIPDKPQSRLQKYRLTDKGRHISQS